VAKIIDLAENEKAELESENRKDDIPLDKPIYQGRNEK